MRSWRTERSQHPVTGGPGSDFNPTLFGRRVLLRPIVESDFEAWSEVRTRNEEWLLKWEPSRLPGQPDPATDREAFVSRCNARDRERQLGNGYGFGFFVDGYLAGEMNLSSVQRGPFMNTYAGYWIDEARAGHGYTPEALVVALQYAFDKLRLHRVQVAIIPRNERSRRVAEKLELREEGVAERYLEINGIWEDHVRYAITSEEWEVRREDMLRQWID